jgi:hypothetical protein
MAVVGVCLEFGPPIVPGCGHAMVAADDRCACPACGAVCRGRFRGCPEVWNRGPQAVSVAGEAPGGPGVARARPAAGGMGADESHEAWTAPTGEPPPTANGRVRHPGQPEPMAISDLAAALSDVVATAGRQLNESQELQLRSLLERIESRLDELIEGLPEPRPPGTRVADDPAAER